MFFAFENQGKGVLVDPNISYISLQQLTEVSRKTAIKILEFSGHFIIIIIIIIIMMIMLMTMTVMIMIISMTVIVKMTIMIVNL